MLTAAIGNSLGSRFTWDPEYMSVPVRGETFTDDKLSGRDHRRFSLYASAISFDDESADSPIAERILSPSVVALEALYKNWRVSPELVLERVHALMPEIQMSPDHVRIILNHWRRLCVVPQWLYDEIDRHTSGHLELKLDGVIEGVVAMGSEMGVAYGDRRVAGAIVSFWTTHCIIPKRVFTNTVFSVPLVNESGSRQFRRLANSVCQDVLAAAALSERRQIEDRLTPKNRVREG